MKIYGGIESLYQWDTGRKITSLKFDAGDEVHFSNTANPEALVVEAYALDDGQIVADIPNILLQNNLPLYVYWMRKGAAGCCCADSKMFLVIKRQKPSDYAYTETEVKNYDALERRLNELEGAGLTKAVQEVLAQLKSEITPARIGEVTLLASQWVGGGKIYSQRVNIDGVTENSQVDLTPTVQQLAIFYEKDISFVTENEGGIVTVYVIGQKPTNDYTIQVTITEVEA